MITQFFLDLMHQLAELLIAGLGALVPEPPAFWSDATSYISTLVSGVVGPIRWFLPFGPVLVIAGWLLALLVVSTAMKLTRMVLSFLTLGGGGIG